MRKSRGVVFRSREPIVITLDDDGDTQIVAERGGAKVIGVFADDIRPDGCDIIAHGAVKEFLGYRSRLVVTLVCGLGNGCNRERQKLFRARDRFGFRAYPLKIDGKESNVYTLSDLSTIAVDYLLSKRGVWIATLEETSIRLPGNGPVDHVAKKPKRKPSSFHPDYRGNGPFVHLPRIKKSRRINVV